MDGKSVVGDGGDLDPKRGNVIGFVDVRCSAIGKSEKSDKWIQAQRVGKTTCFSTGNSAGRTLQWTVSWSLKKLDLESLEFRKHRP